MADVVEQEDGLVITVRRSKTDQDALGRRVGVPYGSHPATCPVRAVRAVRAWRAAAGIDDGPVFRPVDRHGRVGEARLSGTAVALIVKRAAARFGLDSDQFAGHSLHAGLATSAAAAGASERSWRRPGTSRCRRCAATSARDASRSRDSIHRSTLTPVIGDGRADPVWHSLSAATDSRTLDRLASELRAWLESVGTGSVTPEPSSAVSPEPLRG